MKLCTKLKMPMVKPLHRSAMQLLTLKKKSEEKDKIVTTAGTLSRPQPMLTLTIWTPISESTTGPSEDN